MSNAVMNFFFFTTNSASHFLGSKSVKKSFFRACRPTRVQCSNSLLRFRGESHACGLKTLISR